MTLVLVAVLFAALCASVEVFARRLTCPPELPRKLAHVASAVVAAFLPFVLSYAQIALLALAFAALMALSLRRGIFTAIHGVSRTTYGEVYFPLGIAALAIIGPARGSFAYGVLVLGLGDGLAGLVGVRLGKRPVPLIQTTKTLWGSGTFFVASFALGAALTAASGASLVYALLAAAALAAALTPVELFLTHGLDNLALPVLGGSLLGAL